MPEPQAALGKTDVTILEVQEIASPEPQRLGKRDLMVIYQSADNTRHAVRLPAESADDATIARTIRADLDRRGKWAGRRLSV
jgi:hypothetical protein